MGTASLKKKFVCAQDPQITTTTTIDDNDRVLSEQRGKKIYENFVNKQFNVSECSSIVYFYGFFFK